MRYCDSSENYSTPNGTPGTGVLSHYQPTPGVTYFYDGSNVAGGIPYSKGKLTKVTNGTGPNSSTTEYTAFDVLGRVTRSKQTTDGVEYGGGTDPTKWMTYAYNLSGALIEQTYPSGRKVKSTLDAVGNLAQVQSQKSSSDIWRPYASNFVYTAAGAVSSMRLGNGKFENTQFNSRMQPTQIGLGSSATDQGLLKLNYDYGTTNNNGNVLLQTITVPTVGSNNGFVAVQTYSYDSLNRLKQATEMVTPNGGSQSLSWRQTFTFDRYGNRNFDEANTTTLPKDCTESGNPIVCEAIRPIVNPSVNTANNRLNGYTFDAAGNTTIDAEGRQFTYDAENKQVNVKNSQNQTIGEYSYDGDAKRVKKLVPATGESTIFVYDAGGKLIGEYSTIVETQAPKVKYLTNDYLGSPRINTDQDGNVTSRTDYMPYGEEIIGLGNRSANDSYVTDDVRQGFTGYENDSETELNYAKARMQNPSLGRFHSPDPLFFQFRMAIDPQVFNLYAYTRNNPQKWVDPDGERLLLRGNQEWLLRNVLYEMVGGQENFDNYFEIIAGEVRVREGITEMPDNLGVADVVNLINATQVYLYFAGENGNDAVNLFNGYNNVTGGVNAFSDRQRQNLVDRFEGNPAGCTSCGTLVGTSGRWSQLHPQNLANGDAVFAVIAYNTSAVLTQTSISYGEEAGAERDRIAAIAGVSQAAGLIEGTIRPVSFFIHETAENVAFATMAAQGQVLNWSTYRPAHSSAIIREHQVRQELRITGGFSGGGVTSTVPRRQ